jgi:hypothetical protein
MLYGFSNRTLASSVRRSHRFDRSVLLHWVGVVALCLTLAAASVAQAQSPSPTPSSYGDFGVQQTNQLLVLLLGMVFMLILANQTKE